MKKLTLIFVAIFPLLSYSQNYSFSVTKSGSGNTSLLFIPGLASSGDVWNETVETLQTNHTCYVFNMAGFPDITPQTNPSLDKWELEIVQYIKDQQIDNPIIIGHSMGGLLSLKIAADFPNLIRKIVVVDALPCLPALTNPDFQSNSNNDCSEMVRQFTDMSDEQFRQIQKAGIVNLISEKSKYDKILEWSTKSDRETYAIMLCDLQNTDLRDSISNITIPSLILLQPYFRSAVSTINNQYQFLEGAQIAYATKGLHFIMYDDKDWFIAQLIDFIKK